MVYTPRPPGQYGFGCFAIYCTVCSKIKHPTLNPGGCRGYMRYFYGDQKFLQPLFSGIATSLRLVRTQSLDPNNVINQMQAIQTSL